MCWYILPLWPEIITLKHWNTPVEEQRIFVFRYFWRSFENGVECSRWCVCLVLPSICVDYYQYVSLCASHVGDSKSSSWNSRHKDLSLVPCWQTLPALNRIETWGRKLFIILSYRYIHTYTHIQRDIFHPKSALTWIHANIPVLHESFQRFAQRTAAMLPYSVFIFLRAQCLHPADFRAAIVLLLDQLDTGPTWGQHQTYFFSLYGISTHIHSVADYST